jgi:phage gp46-like protein
MTDVLLRQSDDGGEVTVEAGLFLMSEGLETAAYLSLFGGNEQDPADSESEQQWWGNLAETESDRTYRSETQYLIRSLPAVPSNLRRIEQAAARDLQWMIDAGTAKSIAVAANIPALNRVVLEVSIVTLREQIQLSFG